MLFTNLIHNAINYNHKGGSVAICLSREGNNEIISVKDTGVGIPEEKRQLIFEQFYRVNTGENMPGSGLGLAIVRQICDAHSGSVEVESTPGSGSIFTICLPCEPVQAKEAASLV